jgi:triosephosphate isomerase
MAERKPLIAGNWKMFKTRSEAVETSTKLVELTRIPSQAGVLIAPPFPCLDAVSSVIRNSPIRLAAQNLFWETCGAFTGEVSADMLRSVGCEYVIIGHSERRELFGETDDGINRKIKSASAAGLIPIFCIGETDRQREEGKTFSVLDKQIKEGLKDVFSLNPDTLVIAYEPVWAIGTGKTATSQQAQEVHRFLRDVFSKTFGTVFSEGVRILYGGSVKPENIRSLMAMPDIDGALVGGASLDPVVFSQIIYF